MKCFFIGLFYLAFTSANSQTDQIIVYETSKDTEHKLAKSLVNGWQKFEQPNETQLCVFVNSKIKFQSFLGIGGAITDASAEVFSKMPLKMQEEFVDSYFSKTNGHAYSIIRTNINGCDFSSDSYTYIDEGDAELKSFSIKHDLQYKIPLIKKALQVAENQVSVFASPWSPPAFMKSNNNVLKGGFLKPEYYQAWANYYVKFLQAYKEQNIPIWGLTVQNEPLAKQFGNLVFFLLKMNAIL